jgi:tetratricopeptide (TPR) repeat protein
MSSNTLRCMESARSAAITFAAVLTALLAGDARADLKGARDRFLRGDYKGAEAELDKLKGKQVDEVRLERARIQLRTGRYAEAEKGARAVAQSRDSGTQTEARLFLAEVLRVTGRLAEAKKELEPIVQKQPDRRRARWLLGLTYRDLGDARAEKLWKQLDDEFVKNQLDEKESDTWFYLAEAWRYLNNLDDANGAYQQATDRNASLHEANIFWGYLFLEKYNPADSSESFDAVLKIDPRHPDAHAGMAAVKLEASYDLAAATAHLGRAFEINRRHLPALLLRAGIEIDQNQWDKAKATLAEVFAVNPSSLEGHSLMATIHWLRDDTAAYQAARKKVFQLNPAYARFFHIVAKSAVREHRYREAIELEKEAVKVSPAYYEAMEAIGTGYLRLGMEKEGLEWLRKAWKGDEYNMRTKNTLDLFEEFIPREYEFVASKSFKIRYHVDEKPVYRRYIEPVLEQAFADMSKRYAFTPKTPVVIELFQNADHYSVRTIGLPNLGALGVCFGQVITAMSPSVGDINWAMVLWHELSHVFAIQLSSSRVPRWFTEGLAEYETVLARPEWRRENDADVWAAMQDGTLPSLAELNYGFMKPSMQEVTVAYHTSSLAVEYLAQTYGFPRIVEALRLYGKGLETPAVLEKITGKKIALLDGEFRKYLVVRMKPYDGSLHLPIALPGMKALARTAGARPRDAGARARLALAHFYEGDAKPAGEHAAKALAIDPDNHIALYISAELALRAGDAPEARKRYEALIKTGADSFDIRARLGTIAAQLGDDELAVKHFCTAKKLDPERAFPYQALAELYERMGKREDQLRELESYVMIEQMQLGAVKQLVTGYAALKKWDKVRTYGELALDITLADAELFLLLGQAYLETGSPDKALYSYDSALLVRPPMRRPGLAHLGRARALKARGDAKGALAALQKALKLEPDNADAAALKKELRAR